VFRYSLLINLNVLATTLVGIRVLNHVINAAILLFVMSAANSDLYIGSRTLYGLAIEGKAPRIFARVNRLGVPWPALILCTCFCGLVFLNVSSSSAKGQNDYLFLNGSS
jgi:amino acid transporter